jgi:hypothetical protein
MSALAALAAARRVAVKLGLDGDKIVAESPYGVPDGLIEQLRAHRPEILHILKWRDPARAPVGAKRPPDASMDQWDAALLGLHHFLDGGWGKRALALGWSKPELFNLPALWAQISLTGAGWLIGEWQVTSVTAEEITITPPWSPISQLKFRRRDDLRQLPLTTRSEPATADDLVEAIISSMDDKVEVSALPERLLAVMEQEPLDGAAAIRRFMEIDDALFARGIEMWPDHGHIVLGHHGKGCQKRVTVLSLAAAEAEVAAVVDDEAAITRFKAVAEALFGQGVEVVRVHPGVEHLAEDTGHRPAAAGASSSHSSNDRTAEVGVT